MSNRMRLGRMTRWQRRTTYVVLALCASSGIGWFTVLDLLHGAPPVARPWWVVHGITAVFAALAIGGAIAQHVVVTWRAARGRWSGTANLAFLGVLVGTALYLMYGAESGRDTIHWVHCVVGLAAVGVFVGHVVWGRTRVPKLRHAAQRSPRATL